MSATHSFHAPALRRGPAATAHPHVPASAPGPLDQLRGPGSGPGHGGAGWTRGPGARPGHDSHNINHNARYQTHGVFRLYYGLTPRWCPLYRRDKQPAPSGRATPLRCDPRSYPKIQYQNTGLVRNPRQSGLSPAPRATTQTLAQELEKPTDHRAQSGVAGYDNPHPQLTATKFAVIHPHVPVPAPGPLDQLRGPGSGPGRGGEMAERSRRGGRDMGEKP